MLSDVLWEAVKAIMRYRRDPVLGRCYEELAQVLDDLVDHMERVGQLLDQPPAAEQQQNP